MTTTVLPSGVTIIERDGGVPLIIGTAGDDRIDGSDRAEDYQVTSGNDVINAARGFDTLDYNRADGAVTATFTANEAGTVRKSGGTDTFTNVEQITGSPFDDVFVNQADAYVRFRGRDGTDSYTGSPTAIDEIGFRQDPAGVTVDLGAGTAIDGWGNAETFTNMDYVRGSEFDDRITGSDGANRLRGRDGDDTLQGGGGNDEIRGDAGLDIAVFTAARAGATVQGTSADATVTTASDGTDTLTSVERLQFTDGTLALDVGLDENAGTAFRIYQAAFNRTPDVEGLSFWIKAVDNGLSFKAMAAGFNDASEFSALYGGTSNAAYAAALYTNVLGREGDAAGAKFWTDALDAGAVDRADVLLGFTRSSENLSLTAGATQDGIVFV